MKPSFDLKCTYPLTVIRQSTCSSLSFNFSSPYPNSPFSPRTGFRSVSGRPSGYQTILAPSHGPQTPGTPPPSSARQRDPTFHSPNPRVHTSPHSGPSSQSPHPVPSSLLIQTSLHPPPRAGSGPSPPSRPIPTPRHTPPPQSIPRWVQAFPPSPLVPTRSAWRPENGLDQAWHSPRRSEAEQARRTRPRGEVPVVPFRRPAARQPFCCVVPVAVGPCAPRGRSL